MSEHHGDQQLIKKAADGKRPYSKNAAPARVGRILVYVMRQGILVKVGRERYEFSRRCFAIT